MRTFSPAIGRVEIHEGATRNDDLSGAVCAVFVIAVQNKSVGFCRVRILLLNGVEAALNNRGALKNVNGMNVTGKCAVFNGNGRAVLNINRIAVIFFRLNGSVAVYHNINSVLCGKQRPSVVPPYIGGIVQCFPG